MKKRTRIVLYIVSLCVLIGWLIGANKIIPMILDVNIPVKQPILDSYEKDPVYGSLDSITVTNSFTEVMYISGWSFVETEYDNSNRFISVYLVNEDNCYELKALESKFLREDVKSAYSNKKIPNSYVGFQMLVFTPEIKDGIYDVYLQCWENEYNYGLVRLSNQLCKERGTLTNYLWQAEHVNVSSEASVHGATNTYIDNLSIKDGYFSVNGWTYIDGQDSKNQAVYVQLKNASGEVLQYTTRAVERKDVAEAYGNELYIQSGYSTLFSAEDIADGTWELTILNEVDGNVYASNPYIVEKSGSTISVIQ